MGGGPVTAPTTPNAELAYRVLDHIDSHPEQWNQGLYIGKAECGTVACFAGWAVLLSGNEPTFDESYVAHNGVRVTQDCIVDGWAQNVSHRAQELLRADRWVHEGEADEADLFCQFNTRDDLGRMVAEIFGPRPGGAL